MSRLTIEIKADLAAAVIADYVAIEPVRCACGWVLRAFANVPNAPASVFALTGVERCTE